MYTVRDRKMDLCKELLKEGANKNTKAKVCQLSRLFSCISCAHTHAPSDDSEWHDAAHPCGFHGLPADGACPPGEGCR